MATSKKKKAMELGGSVHIWLKGGRKKRGKKAGPREDGETGDVFEPKSQFQKKRVVATSIERREIMKKKKKNSLKIQTVPEVKKGVPPLPPPGMGNQAEKNKATCTGKKKEEGGCTSI